MNSPKSFFSIFFLIITLLNIVFSPESFASNHPKELIIASKYTIKNIDYNNFTLSKIHKKLTIVIFWASWCGNCPDKLLFLENLYQKYQSRDLEIIAINIDSGKNIKNFIKFSNEINFFNILIKNITRLEFPAPTSLPDIYLIDKNFNIKRISEIELKSLNIVALLAENSSALQPLN